MDETYEKLTLLYLQSRDLSDTSPEQLYDLYEETKNRIKDRNVELMKSRKEEKRSNTTIVNPLF